MSNDAYKNLLGEVAEVRQGYPFRGAIPEISAGSVRVVQMKDLSRDGLRSADDLLATEIAGRKPSDWLQAGDILFVSRGASPYAALIAEPPPRTLASPHLYLIRVRHAARLLPAFLAWQLNQPPAQRTLMQLAEGSHQLSIRRAVLEQIEIRIPPLARQQAVVALDRTARAERSALHALIDNRTAQLTAIAEHLLG